MSGSFFSAIQCAWSRPYQGSRCSVSSQTLSIPSAVSDGRRGLYRSTSSSNSALVGCCASAVAPPHRSATINTGTLMAIFISPPSSVARNTCQEAERAIEARPGSVNPPATPAMVCDGVTTLLHHTGSELHQVRRGIATTPDQELAPSALGHPRPLGSIGTKREHNTEGAACPGRMVKRDGRAVGLLLGCPCFAIKPTSAIDRAAGARLR